MHQMACDSGDRPSVSFSFHAGLKIGIELKRNAPSLKGGGGSVETSLP